MNNVFVGILAAVVLAGCATQRSVPRIVLRDPSNTIAASITARVQPDGSFAQVVQNGNSTVEFSGHVAQGEGGLYDVDYRYHSKIEGEAGMFRTKMFQSNVSIPPRTEQPIGGMITVVGENGHSPSASSELVSIELTGPITSNTPLHGTRGDAHP